MVRVHTDGSNASITYHANTASCAFVCWLLFALNMLLLPFIVAFYTGGFWRKEVFIRERPLVRFRGEALVEAYVGPSVTDRIGWSSSGELNAALGSKLRPCQLRAWTEDDDRDDKPELLQFALSIPVDLLAGERVHSVSLMVGVEARSP